jgi:preprotein translocase subunit SecG
MQVIIVLLHIVVCFALILIVLLQKGKGADMGSAFGGSSQTVFGGAGASSFLTKMTTAAAIIFMITCLLLAFMLGKGKQTTSIMDGVKTTAPATEQSSAPATTQSTAPAGEQSQQQ